MYNTMTPIPPKTALITGCSEGGIGHALALEFSHRGVHVFATARTPSKMASLENNPNITLLAMDVTSQTSIDAALTTITTSKVGIDGTLDYLVNNAGGQVVMPVLDLDMEVARQMYEVNFWGTLATIKTFAPLVIKAKGTIANLSSIGASLYLPYLGEFTCVDYVLTIACALLFTKKEKEKLLTLPCFPIPWSLIFSRQRSWKICLLNIVSDLCEFQSRR